MSDENLYLGVRQLMSRWPGIFSSRPAVGRLIRLPVDPLPHLRISGKRILYPVGPVQEWIDRRAVGHEVRPVEGPQGGASTP